MIYYCVGFIFSFFALSEITKELKHLKKLFVAYSFIILAFFAGTRFDLGDYFSYIEIFEKVNSLGDIFQNGFNYNEVHGEFLYLLLNSIVKSWTVDSTYLFCIVAVASVGINIYCYKKFSPYVLLSILLYFSHSYIYKELIQIRNGLASALVLLSVIFIQRQQLLKFLSIVLIASLFHAGALIAVPVYFLNRINFQKYHLYLFLLFAVVIASTVSWMHLFLAKLVAFGLLPSAVGAYIGWDQHDYMLGVLNPVTVKQIVVSILAIKYRDLLSKNSTYFDSLFCMYFFSTIILILFNEFAIIAARLASCLSVGEPILIPLLIFSVRGKKYLVLLVTLAACLLLYTNISLKKVVPDYKSVLFE